MSVKTKKSSAPVKKTARKPATKKVAAKKPVTIRKPTIKPSVKVEEVKVEVKVDDGPKVYFAPPSPRLGDAPTHPVVNAKCRRGGDRQTEGQACNSLSAENLTPQGSNTVQFRCVKCKHTWSIPMGGSFQGV